MLINFWNKKFWKNGTNMLAQSQKNKVLVSYGTKNVTYVFAEASIVLMYFEKHYHYLQKVMDT